ncbi:MAG: hypothetical protein ACRC1T_05780 [Clostridium chrysemydis]|uniref:hypothetical protein n=1 Tax=Clostridium chrysemydis TaxID=2665504 RepID=UPI003F3D87AD
MKKRKFISFLTLVFFLITNYSPIVTEAVTLSSNKNLLNSFMTEFKKLTFDNFTFNRVTPDSVEETSPEEPSAKLSENIDVGTLLTKVGLTNDINSSDNYSFIDADLSNQELYLPSLQNNNVFEGKNLIFKTKSKSLDGLKIYITNVDGTNKAYSFAKLAPNTNYLIEGLNLKNGDNIRFLLKDSSDTILDFSLKVTDKPNKEFTAPEVNSSFIKYDEQKGKYTLNINYKEHENAMPFNLYKSCKLMLDSSDFSIGDITITKDSTNYNLVADLNLNSRKTLTKNAISINYSLYSVGIDGTVSEKTAVSEGPVFNKPELNLGGINLEDNTLTPNDKFSLFVNSDTPLNFSCDGDLNELEALENNKLYLSLINSDTNKRISNIDLKPLENTDNISNPNSKKFTYELIFTPLFTSIERNTLEGTVLPLGNYKLDLLLVGSNKEDPIRKSINISVIPKEAYLETDMEGKIYNSTTFGINFALNSFGKYTNLEENYINLNLIHNPKDSITKFTYKISGPEAFEKIVTEKDLSKNNSIKFDFTKTGKYKIELIELEENNQKVDLPKNNIFEVNFDSIKPKFTTAKFIKEDGNFVIDNDISLIGVDEIPVFEITDSNEYKFSTPKIEYSPDGSDTFEVIDNLEFIKDKNSNYHYLTSKKKNDSNYLNNGSYRITIENIKDLAGNSLEPQIFEFKVATSIPKDQISYSIKYLDNRELSKYNDIYHFNNDLNVEFNIPELAAGYENISLILNQENLMTLELTPSKDNTFLIEKGKLLTSRFNLNSKIKATLSLKTNTGVVNKDISFDLQFDDSLLKPSFLNPESLDYVNYDSDYVSTKSESLKFKFNEALDFSKKDSYITLDGKSILEDYKNSSEYLIQNNNDKNQILKFKVYDYALNVIEMELKINFDSKAPSISTNFSSNNLNDLQKAVYNSNKVNLNINFNNDKPITPNSNDFVVNIEEENISSFTIKSSKVTSKEDLNSEYDSKGEEIFKGIYDAKKELTFEENSIYKLSILARDIHGEETKIVRFIYIDTLEPKVNLICSLDDFETYKSISTLDIKDDTTIEQIKKFAYANSNKNLKLGLIVEDLTLNFDNFIAISKIPYLVGDKDYNLSYEKEEVKDNEDLNKSVILKLDTSTLQNRNLDGTHKLKLDISDGLNSTNISKGFYLDNTLPNFDYNFRASDKDENSLLAFDKDNHRLGTNGRFITEINLLNSETYYNRIEVFINKQINFKPDIVKPLYDKDISNGKVEFEVNLLEHLSSIKPDKNEITFKVYKNTGKFESKTITTYLDSKVPILNLYLDDTEVKADKASYENTFNYKENYSPLKLTLSDSTLLEDYKLYSGDDIPPSNSTNYVKLNSIAYEGNSNFDSKNFELIKGDANSVILRNSKESSLNTSKLNLEIGKYTLNFTVKDFVGNTKTLSYTLFIENKKIDISLKPLSDSIFSYINDDVFYISDKEFKFSIETGNTFSKFTNLSLDFVDSKDNTVIYTKVVDTDFSGDKIHEVSITPSDFKRPVSELSEMKLKINLVNSNPNVSDNGVSKKEALFKFDRTPSKLDLNVLSSTNNLELLKPYEKESDINFIDINKSKSFKVNISDEFGFSNFKTFSPDDKLNLEDMPNSSINLKSLKYNSSDYNDPTTELENISLSVVKNKNTSENLIIKEKDSELVLKPGKYEFEFLAKDIVGNVTTRSYVVVVDDLSPTINSFEANSITNKEGNDYILGDILNLKVKLNKTYLNYSDLNINLSATIGSENIDLMTLSKCTLEDCSSVNSSLEHNFEVKIEDILNKVPNNLKEVQIEATVNLSSDFNSVNPKKITKNFILDRNNPSLELLLTNDNNKKLSNTLDNKLSVENNNLLNVSISDKYYSSNPTIVNPNEPLPERDYISLKSIKFNNSNLGDELTELDCVKLKLKSSKDGNFIYSLVNDENKEYKLEKGKYELIFETKDISENYTSFKYSIIVDNSKVIYNMTPNSNISKFDDLYHINNNDFKVNLSIPKIYSGYSDLTLKIKDKGNTIYTISKGSDFLKFDKEVETFVLDVEASKFNLSDSKNLTLEISLQSPNDSIEIKPLAYSLVYDVKKPELKISASQDDKLNTLPYFGKDPNFVIYASDINNLGVNTLDKDNIVLNDISKPNSLSIETFSYLKEGSNKPTELKGSFKVIKSGNNFSIVRSNGTSHNFTNGEYNLKLNLRDKSDNSVSVNYNFKIDTEKPTINSITLSSKNGTSVTHHKNVYYVNGDFIANVDVAKNYAPNTTLDVTLKVYDENKKDYIDLFTKSYVNESIVSVKSFDFGFVNSNDIKLVATLYNANGKKVSKEIKMISEKVSPSILLDYNKNDVKNNDIFSISSNLDVNVKDTSSTSFSNIDLDTVSLYTNSSLLKPNSINLKNVTFEDLYSESNITNNFTLKKFNNTISLAKNDSRYSLPTGKYTVSLEAKDLCGNSTSKTFVFTVDTKSTSGDSKLVFNKINSNIATTLDANKISNTIYVPYNATLSLNLDGNISGFKGNSNITVKDDNGNNITSSTFVTGNGISNNGSINSNKNAKQVQFKFKDDGIYNISWNLEAKNNIDSYKKSITVVVDTKNPVINLDLVNKTATKDKTIYTNSTKHYADYSVEDTNFNTISNLSYKVNLDSSSPSGIMKDEIYNEGTYNISITATDKAGRSSSKSIKVIVDRTSPKVSLPNESMFNRVNGTYYTNKIRPYLYDVSDSYLDQEAAFLNNRVYTKGSSISGDGTKNIKVVAKDIAGNITEKTFNFVLDTLAPILNYSDVIDEKHYNKPVKPSFKATDLHFNKDSLSVLLNGRSYNNNPISADGKYNFKLSVSDFAGNASTLNFSFVVDTVAPIITINGILFDKLNSGTIIPEIVVNDKDAIVTSLLNGDSYYGEPIMANGKVTLIVSAVDKAGNYARKVANFMLDSYAPEIFLNGVENGKSYNSFVHPKITSERGSNLKMLLNGKPYNNEKVTEPGDYVLEIITTDKVNNTNKQVINFKILSSPEAESIEDSKMPILFFGILFLILIASIVGYNIYKKNRN